MKLLEFFRRMNPIQPLFEMLDIWDKSERRRLAWRALERQSPGRKHTATEWDALAEEFLSVAEKHGISPTQPRRMFGKRGAPRGRRRKQPSV